MKKILILSIAATMCVFNAYADTWKDCGTNCQYQIVDGTLTIKAKTGNNGKITQRPWTEGDENVTNIVFDQSMTNLGDYNLVNLKSEIPVIIPSGVTALNGTFAWCNISEVEIPDSVEKIGAYAFRATHLTNVIIPDSVKTVSDAAFSLTSLQSLVVGENTQLGDIFVCRGSCSGDEDTSWTNFNNFQMYCAQGNTSCKTALELAGATPTQIANVIKTYTKDGNRYVVNGVKYRTLADMQKQNPVKRIYTVEEAAKLSKPTGNTIKLRYK